MRIFIILFLLTGCSSYDHESINITLQNTKSDLQSITGYNEKIDRFEYLLRNSVDEMLSNIKVQKNYNEAFILNLSFRHKNQYDSIKKSKIQSKHTFNYTIKYELISLKSKKSVLSGTINSVHSFFTPTYFFSDVISAEDSQISAIANITKQLELEIQYFLDNTFK
jgi:hypothetical protein